jgi:hypothetical protein
MELYSVPTKHSESELAELGAANPDFYFYVLGKKLVTPAPIKPLTYQIQIEHLQIKY